MSELRGRRSSVILGCVTAAVAGLALVLLLLAAGRDPHANAWGGRAFGLATTAAALVVGLAAVLFARPNETHYWGMVGALSISAAIAGAYSYKPRVPQASDRAEQIPMAVGGWLGQTIVQDPDTRRTTEEVLGTRDIVMRQYRRGNDMVDMTVVFAMSDRKGVHPPEQCSAAEGNELERLTADSFTAADGRVIGVRRLLLTNKGGHSRLMMFWYKVGDFYTGNFARQQFQVIWQNLLGRSGVRVALLRFSTLVAGHDDEERGARLLKEFAREIFPEIEEKLR